MSKILVPVDFSEQSAGAARYALALAEHFRAELSLLYVRGPELEPWAMDVGLSTPVWRRQPLELAQKRLDGFLAEPGGGAGVRRVVMEGDPAQTIVSYAHDLGAALIVMPTHGYGPFRRFLLGSVTAKVLHDAECPVWTGVHLEQAPPIETVRGGNVVCGVDLGPHSRCVVEWAARVVEDLGAGFVVVHAIPALEAEAGEHFDSQWRVRVENQAVERVEDMLRESGVRAEVLVSCGDAPRVVRCAALRYRATLLVIGRGSAAGIFGRLRTNAYAILRESPCPVVSV
jgi:nucleotide-binding universal stress UspA family protein